MFIRTKFSCVLHQSIPGKILLIFSVNFLSDSIIVYVLPAEFLWQCKGHPDHCSVEKVAPSFQRAKEESQSTEMHPKSEREVDRGGKGYEEDDYSDDIGAGDS